MNEEFIILISIYKNKGDVKVVRTIIELHLCIVLNILETVEISSDVLFFCDDTSKKESYGLCTSVDIRYIVQYIAQTYHLDISTGMVYFFK